MKDELKRFASDWFEQVWNLGDESAVDRMMSPDVRFHGLVSRDAQPAHGPEAFKSFSRAIRSAIPDIRIDVLRSLGDGDTLVTYCRVTGHHTGPGLGRAATGAAVEIYGLAMAVVHDGVIQECWNCFDFLTLYQQVGLLPALPVAP